MKKITCLLFSVSFLCVEAQIPAFNWARTFGCPSQSSFVYTTKSDQNGNVVSAGQFAGTVDFDSGPGTYSYTSTFNSSDVFVTKHNTNGGLVWAKAITANGTNDLAYEMCTDAAGNSYVTGQIGGTADLDTGPGTYTLSCVGNDVFIVKFDANGNFVWGRFISGPNADYGQDICVDNAGNVYALCRISGGNIDVDPGPGFVPMFFNNNSTLLLKLDNAGNFISAKKIEGSAGSQSIPRAIITDKNDNLFVSGDYTGNVDFDPGPSTYTIPFSPSFNDAYLEKFDASGNFSWVRSINGSSGQKAIYDLQTDNSGNVYAVGQFSGTVDFDSGPGTTTLNAVTSLDAFVLKYSNAGNFKGVTRWGGNSLEVILEISKDAYNNLYLGGYFAGTLDFDPGPASFTLSSPNGNYDPFVLKIDTAINFLWAARYGGNGLEVGLSIGADANSNVYSGGYFASNPIDFDPGPATANATLIGTYDAYVHKMNGCTAPPAPIGLATSVLSVCANSSGIINVSGVGTFSWYTSTTSTTAIASGSTFITPTLSLGTYTYYVSANTCTNSVARNAIAVYVNDPPTVVASTSSAQICAGATVALTATGANTYSWSNGGTGSVIVVQPVLTTQYIVTGYVGGCSSQDTITQNVAWCIGISEHKSEDIRLNLSPNPNAGSVKVDCETIITSYKIMDIAGKELVFRDNIYSTNFTIDLSELQNSVYILRLGLSDGRSKERKLIIQK
jgi:hypothetical protein